MSDHSSEPAPTTSPHTHRVLVVSADMGGGHNSTASALEQEIARRWPGSVTRRVDALDLMGVGGPFRSIYVSNVEHTPWLYEFFYANLWRHRWFADASKQFTGSWCGRRLAGELARFDPDLIVSTYPLGSSGLAWLRRHRGLAVPTAAWVSDFAPHPFWVYRDVDLTVVLHEAAALTARAAEPGARVLVGPLPVRSEFRPEAGAEAEPVGRSEASESRDGESADRFRVLVSAGSYSFGDVVSVVETVLAASPQAQVIAVCGRNRATVRRLLGLRLPAERLTVLGWVAEMAPVIRAADLVLTNAGGATALEALASATPVVMYQPIAAHGRANSDLMVVSGLADVVLDQDRLVDYVRAAISHVGEPDGLEVLRRRELDHVRRADLADPLAELAAVRPVVHGHARLRSEDALFAAVETESLRQEIGVTCEIAPSPQDGPLTLAALRAALEPRALALTALRRRLVRGHRLGWQLDPGLDIARHVDEVVVKRPAGAGWADQAISEFWSEPLSEDRPAWRVLLIRRADDPDRSDDTAASGEVVMTDVVVTDVVMAMKQHHSVADGISALSLLDRLFDDPVEAPGEPAPELGRADPADRPAGPRAVRAVRSGLRQAALVGRGLVSLAGQGRAPAQPMNRPVPTSRRQLVTWAVPRSELRRVARQLDARPHELVMTLLADALTRVLLPAGLVRPGGSMRAMIPVSLRPVALDRLFGNWTGTVALDLPIDPMPFEARLRAVSADLRRRVDRGEPHAGHLALWLAGRLPEPVFARFARLVYGQRFMNTLLSYLPGPRGERTLAGRPVRTVVPVLPLAPNVPIVVGVLTFGETTSFGITLDPTLDLDTEQVRGALTEAWRAADAGSAAPQPLISVTEPTGDATHDAETTGEPETTAGLAASGAQA